MLRWCKVLVCLGFALLAAGCPKGQTDYDQAKKAENLQDYDDAYVYYQKAVKADPNNANFKIKVNQARFDDGQMHLQRGYAARKKEDLQTALAEFQRALFIDPSSSVAEQEIQRTMATIAELSHAADTAAEPEPETGDQPLASLPPELKPLSNAAITLTMTNDAKMVFDTIGKLAGLTVIYDPDFTGKQIKSQLNNVTLQQALDITSLQAKAFWKPVTENIIFVIPDQPQKRRDYEEEVVKTFYLGNTVQAQDITEIITGLRQLLDMKRLQQLNSQNAIIARDTPDKLALAEKMIRDIDKAKPEVIIQVQVLQARTDRLRDLGILPGQTVGAAIVPHGTTTTNTGGTPTTGGTTTSTSGTITLDQLRHIGQSDISLTLPSFTANAVLTDTYTKIIQDPEIRSVDGQPAKLRVGDKVPVATGSFQAGVGVGSTGGAGVVNPLVNTQFQYLDVGVNVDITPRVHPNHEVSMKVKVEVSSVTGTSTIGGIQQPIISQRTIEHDIRLKEGEVNVLGGLFEKTESRTLNGWPGLAKIPFLRYLFSSDNTDHQDNEVLILLTPRIVRMPEWTRENLRPLYSGTETSVQVKHESAIRAPSTQTPAPVPTTQGPLVNPGGAAQLPPPGNATANNTAPQSGAPARMKFEPQSLALKAGQEVTVAISVDNVNDLFSIPMLLQYNPKVISIEDVEYAAGQGGSGGFLSGGTQEIAIVKRIDPDKGQAIISATRQPNTPGVTGSGTLLGLKIKALATGTSNLSIVQVNAKDSQQRLIPLITSEATLQVQP
jgi:general secretion pathway protein D